MEMMTLWVLLQREHREMWAIMEWYPLQDLLPCRLFAVHSG